MEPKIPAILSLLALMLACCSAFENGEQNSHIAEPYPHQRQFDHSRQSRQQLLILCTQYGFMPYPMDTTKVQNNVMINYFFFKLTSSL